jgi:hypothetical protein
VDVLEELGLDYAGGDVYGCDVERREFYAELF